MQVVPVSALRDNYAYLVIDERRQVAVVIDPSEAELVEAALRARGLGLAAIFNTHHHWDHVGGNEALVANHRCPVVVGFDDATKVGSCTNPVRDESMHEIAGFRFRALHVPGHTRGAATYLFDDCAFTGDTLFVLGCGRLFEGTAEEMFHSLGRLSALPESTKLYSGHEYALENLAFAETLNERTAALLGRAEDLRARRRVGAPTVPATVAEERATNPFLRAESVEVFRRLRAAKDDFRSPESR